MYTVTFLGYTRHFIVICVFFCAEKDVHDEVIWTWIYPSISVALRDTIKRRVDVVWDSDLTPFFYGQFQKQWHYICSEDVSLDRLPKVYYHNSVFACLFYSNISKVINLCKLHFSQSYVWNISFDHFMIIICNY